VSPKGPKTKSKPSKKASKSGTGVAAAALDVDTYGQSTDVSSPIRTISRRRKGKNPYIDDEAEHDENDDDDDTEADLDRRGYVRDGFVASEGSEDDDFEPVRNASKRTAVTRSRPLGPPITSDNRLVEANLNGIHQMVIQQFVVEAKKLEEKIRNEKGLRRALFSDQDLREMAINWTTTVDEMLEIRSINIDRVRDYGARFLPLVHRFHDTYEKMMHPVEDRDIDENHMNVIDLVSDEEEEEEDEEPPEDEPSPYFGNAPVQAFREMSAAANKKTSLALSCLPPIQLPQSSSNSFPRRGRGGKSAGGSSFRGNNARGGSRSNYRRTSGSHQKSRSTSGTSSGVAKRKPAAKRSSGGGSRSTRVMTAYSKPKKGGDSGGGGIAGIFAMPT
jgi:bloom syndrome protein